MLYLIGLTSLALVEVGDIFYKLGLALWMVRVTVYIPVTCVVEVVMYLSKIGLALWMQLDVKYVLGTRLVDAMRINEAIGLCMVATARAWDPLEAWRLYNRDIKKVPSELYGLMWVVAV